MSYNPVSTSKRAISRYLLAALVSVGILIPGVLFWGATSELSGAVVGQGTVVVEGFVKRIQHREGGIIRRILIAEGEKVAAGELLLSLDDTVTRANLSMVINQIDQLLARKMRLSAEKSNEAEPAPKRELLLRMNDPEVAGNVAAEKILFQARRQTVEGQKAQLQQRIHQFGREGEGIDARLRAKSVELEVIDKELLGISKLYANKLAPFSRLAELQRTRAEVEGERGQLVAEKARVAAQTAETHIQILQLDEDRRTEVLTELREVDSKLAELTEQRITAEDQLSRTEILSPQSGFVHELAVHTVGGVVGAGETIMHIVPTNDRLMVEVKIQPTDIDQVHINQSAILRFSAFNQRTTPELSGKVQTIGANLSTDNQTGHSWYTIRVSLTSDEIAKLGELELHAGMPVEAFLQTANRSALSYLFKPFVDQIRRAMRED